MENGENILMMRLLAGIKPAWIYSGSRIKPCRSFLCKHEGKEVQLEIKAFAKNGRIVLTSTELRRAAMSKESYFLIGVLDDKGPENKWKTFIKHNPLNELLQKGEFDFNTKLAIQVKKNLIRKILRNNIYL